MLVRLQSVNIYILYIKVSWFFYYISFFFSFSFHNYIFWVSNRSCWRYKIIFDVSEITCGNKCNLELGTLIHHKIIYMKVKPLLDLFIKGNYFSVSLFIFIIKIYQCSECTYSKTLSQCQMSKKGSTTLYLFKNMLVYLLLIILLLWMLSFLFKLDTLSWIQNISGIEFWFIRFFPFILFVNKLDNNPSNKSHF